MYCSGVGRGVGMFAVRVGVVLGWVGTFVGGVGAGVLTEGGVLGKIGVLGTIGVPIVAGTVGVETGGAGVDGVGRGTLRSLGSGAGVVDGSGSGDSEGSGCSHSVITAAA